MRWAGKEQLALTKTRRRAMTTAMPFSELLEQNGARPGRGRRWWCARCDGGTPALAVDLERELFFCHRCQWRGGRGSLERELGITTPKPSPAEVRKRRIVRAEAERFVDWTRRRRIETAALLRALDGYERRWREVGRAELAAGGPVSERVWKKLQLAAAWQERAEIRWRRLDFEKHAPELYAEFVSRGKAT